MTDGRKEQSEYILKNNYGYKNSVSRSSFTIYRNGLATGVAFFADVFGNIYGVGAGDQLNRYFLTRIVNASIQDTPILTKSNDSATLSKGTYAITLLGFFGNITVSYT